MSKKRFTEEEVEAFRANPNVARVSPLSIRFTEAFQQKAVHDYLNGSSVMEILQDAGLDIQALGLSRIYAFRHKLQESAEQERRGKEVKSGFSSTGNDPVEQRVLRLENELARTRQEVEFLKKLQTVNMEAMKQWESRRRRR